MNNTMTRRIFRSTLLVGVVVLLAALALVMGVLYSYFGRVQESQLRDELSLAAVGVTQSGEDYLRQLKSDQYRITWVAADGSVLFDTQAGCLRHGEPRPAAGGAAGPGLRRGREQPVQQYPAAKDGILRQAAAGWARCCACPPSA